MKFFRRRSSTDGREKTPVTIKTASVESVEKRTRPFKQYYYIIHVTWSDDTTNVIYRSYGDFHELNWQLRHVFKNEAGAIDPEDRILPFLTGRSVFRTGGNQRRALKTLDEYCKSLIKMPSHICNAQDVIDFFRPLDQDVEHNQKGRRKASGTVELSGKDISKGLQLESYRAVAAYTPQSQGKDQMELVQGLVVEVIEKNDTGWWLVATDDGQGWAPSSYLERVEKPLEDQGTFKFSPGNEETYMVVSAHTPRQLDELALSTGALVEVVEKTLDGWWMVRCDGKSGRVPASNLQKPPMPKRRKSSSSGTLPGLARKSSTSRGNQDDADTLPGASQTRPRVAPKPKTSSTPAPRSPAIEVAPPPVSKKPSNALGCRFIAHWNFSPKGQGLSVKKGEELVLVEKSPEWWLMERADMTKGWVPASYLRPFEGAVKGPGPSREEVARPAQASHLEQTIGIEHDTQAPRSRPVEIPSGEEVAMPAKPSSLEHTAGIEHETQALPSPRSRPVEMPSREEVASPAQSSHLEHTSGIERDIQALPSLRSPGMSEQVAAPGNSDKEPIHRKDSRDNTDLKHSNISLVHSKHENSPETQETIESEAGSPTMTLSDSGYFTVPRTGNDAEKDSEEIVVKSEPPPVRKTPAKIASSTPNLPVSHRTAVPLDVTLGENPSPQQGATYNMGKPDKVTSLSLKELEGKPVYMSRTNFTGGEENETDLESGELVVVLQKDGRGWWQVQSKGGLGWVPSHFLRNTAELFDSNKHGGDKNAAPAQTKNNDNTAESEKQKLMRAPRELPDHSKYQRRQRDRIKATPIEAKVNKKLNQDKKPSIQPSLRILEDNLKPMGELLKLWDNDN